MSRPVDGGLSTRLNPFGPQWPNAKGTDQAPTVGSQVKQVLFGRLKPAVLDPALFPMIAEQLKLLRKYKKKLAVMAGDEEGDYDIQLCEGTVAMIDEEGTIFVGRGFLQACKDHDEVLVGVLAHEVGHRPKRWNQYETRRQLTYDELKMLCRHEETRADIFAGKALAEMGMDAEPLCEFLQAVEDGPHPEYFPAEVRGEVIRDAHAGRTYRADNRRKMFPGFDRMTSPKGHLGEY